MNATFGHSPEHTVRELLRLTDQLLSNQILEGTGYTVTVLSKNEKEEEAS